MWSLVSVLNFKECKDDWIIFKSKQIEKEFKTFAGFSTNRFSGFAGTVSNTVGDFNAANNLLTQSAIDAILLAFVNANKTTGTRILTLNGTGN